MESFLENVPGSLVMRNNPSFISTTQGSRMQFVKMTVIDKSEKK